MRLFALLLLTLSASSAAAQFEDVVIETTPLTDSLHMLTGRGGNLLVCTGPDGAFLVDDEFAPLTDRIRAAIGEITDQEVRFVLNTHVHGDHTGGNENFGLAGAVIVAQDNVRERMSVEQFSAFRNETTPAAPGAALPIVTFTQGVTFHVNGETVEVTHLERAHTDGDAVVYFRKANVLHTGDVVFWGLYPFVDLDSGGSVDGIIAGCDWLLAAGDAETRYVPGHGPLIGPAEVTAYRDMVRTIRDSVAALIGDGKTLEEVQAAKPTAAYDEEWGHTWLTGDQFTEAVFRSLSE